MRNSNNISTINGVEFNPTEPKLSDILIEDIAHALAYLCRANGHFKSFYSIAQHSVNCCLEAKLRGYSQRVQLACLLHDASEAYLSDITRPVKRQLRDYCLFEEKMQELIFEKFGIGDLTDGETELVKSVDDCMLYHEFKKLNGAALFEAPPRIVMDLDTAEYPFSHFENEFMRLFSDCRKNLLPRNSQE